MEFAIYLAGVVLFSAFYYQVKAALGGGVWFVLGVVVYLLCVRVIGRYVSRRFSKSHPNGESR